MSEYLAAAAEKMGVPEAMVLRSAEARAKAGGASVDDILQAWAGGEAVASSAAASADEDASATASATAEEVATASADEPAVDSEPAPEPVAPAPAAAAAAAAPAAVTPPPAPETVTPDEAGSHPVVVSVPTAGLMERVASSVPRWLAAVFMIIPAIGLLYLAGTGSAAECVDGGIALAIDPVTGQAVNCDGSPFEGRGEPGGGADFMAIGEGLYNGGLVSGVNCAGCHGINGGGGVGPGFGAVNLVFPSCADHIDWIALGTSGYQAAGIPTYGALEKPVGGGGNMPGFESSLTPEQIAAVTLYERVRFGGADEQEALVDCGLAEPEGGEEGEGGEGETPADGEAPAEGEASAPSG